MTCNELRVMSGEARGQALTLVGGSRFVVGRAKECDLVLDDKALSRSHFAIQLDSQGCTIEDLSSFNGTFVNGRRLRATQPLCHLDLISVGRHQLAYLETADLEATEVIEDDAPRCESCGSLLDVSLELALGLVDLAQTICALCRQLGQHELPQPLAQTTIASQQLGRFTLHGSLGSGASGMVFKAWDTEQERWLALKLLVPREVSSMLIQRFLEEARIIASLDHPGIVRCYDLGRVEQLLFIALEYLGGVDLEAWIQREGPPTIRQALDWGVALCEAIQYAHDRGVIHRDLKPANILIDPDGQLRIIDFGLSRAFDHSGLRMTQSCNFLGTPHYMSPEQIDNVKQVDHRTDLYALGVILYRLLTGANPFRTDHGDLMALFQAKLDCESRPIDDLRSDLPAGLAQTITRAMAPAARDRFQSAAALGSALQGACDQLTLG